MTTTNDMQLVKVQTGAPTNESKFRTITNHPTNQNQQRHIISFPVNKCGENKFHFQKTERKKKKIHQKLRLQLHPITFELVEAKSIKFLIYTYTSILSTHHL